MCLRKKHTEFFTGVFEIYRKLKKADVTEK